MSSYLPIPTYLIKLRTYLWALEKDENYEECCYIRDMITAIENRDMETYLSLAVPVNDLVENGFLEKGDTLDQINSKLCSFFSIPDLFHYQVIDRPISDHLAEAREIQSRVDEQK